MQNNYLSFRPEIIATIFTTVRVASAQIGASMLRFDSRGKVNAKWMLWPSCRSRREWNWCWAVRIRLLIEMPNGQAKIFYCVGECLSILELYKLFNKSRTLSTTSNASIWICMAIAHSPLPYMPNSRQFPKSLTNYLSYFDQSSYNAGIGRSR